LDFPSVERDKVIFRAITCETLLLWGTKDLYFPPEHGLTALERIPNSRLRVYEGVGHSLHRSIPERFNSDLAMFLDEQS
ncbi:MAG: alpha/beta hydrolase, partial [Dehalococcoidia bacterium]|nr:alpha/beta hydrolase [Dehalococcoidia bacterium]